MEKKIIIIGDTHGNFHVIEEILKKENSSEEVVALLHAGDIGLYDERSIGDFDQSTGEYNGRLSPREIQLLIKHNNPVDQFIPYIKGEKKFPVPFYFIPGNHEDFELYRELLNKSLYVPNCIPIHPGKAYTILLGKKEEDKNGKKTNAAADVLKRHTIF